MIPGNHTSENSCKALHIGFAAFRILVDWSGVERVVAQLAQAMLRRGHSVSVLVPNNAMVPRAGLPVMPLPAECNVIPLDIQSPCSVRSALLEADLDLVMGAFGGDDMLKMPWLLQGTHIPYLAAQVLDPQTLCERMLPYDYFGSLMLADTIQVLLPCYQHSYPDTLKPRIETVGNPSPPPAAAIEVCEEKEQHVLLGLGRMEEKVKRVSLLMRAWSLLYEDFPDWSLRLVGDGPHIEMHRALAAAMGKQARIALVGSTGDVTRHYAEADIFCLPSRAEGLPMVLLEAAAHQLPLVGMADCIACAQLLSDETGALVQTASPAALAEALRGLMVATAHQRAEKGRAAQKLFGCAYEENLVFDQWEALFQKTAAAKGNTEMDKLFEHRLEEDLLRAAALEICARENPLVPEYTAPQETPKPESEISLAAAVLRLVDEKRELAQQNAQLQRKYDALLAQLSAVASNPAHHKSHRKKG